MYPVLSVLLLLMALTLVGYPFWKAHRGEWEEDGWFNPELAVAEGAAGVVSDHKEMLMNTLSEIEFDYRMKKLSEEDYRSLKNDYAHAALATLEVEDSGAAEQNGGLSRSSETEESSWTADRNLSMESGLVGVDEVAEIEREIERELQALANANRHD